MALPPTLARDLVTLLDEAFSHALWPGRDAGAVYDEAAQRVTQGRDAYLADIHNANGGAVPVPVQQAHSTPGTLPDGWEEGISGWFVRLRRRGTSQSNAQAFATHIDEILRRHPVSLSASHTPATPAAPAPLSEAHPAGASTKPALPSLSPLVIPGAPSAAETSPPSASTPALSASSHRAPTPEGLSPATPDPAAPALLPKDGVPAKVSCTSPAADREVSPAAEREVSPAAEREVSPAAERDASPGPVYGPYSPAPASPPRHSTPVPVPSTDTPRDLTPFLASGLLIDSTVASPFLASTPALSAPPSARVGSPSEHDGPQLATPGPLADALALALWGIALPSSDPTELAEGFGRPSSPQPPSSPVIKPRLLSSRPSSPLRTSSPPTSVRSFPTQPAAPAPEKTRTLVAAKVATWVAAYCETFEDVLTLSHVCRAFRTALISAPDLWVDVQVFSTPKHAVLEELLARSVGAQQPLSITVVVTQVGHFPSIVPVLAAVVGRTQHLAISFRKPWAVARRMLRRLVELPAPELQSLELRFNTDGRPESLFGGRHQITTLACQLWQLEKVDVAHLASVREFIALPPPPSADQRSHTASNVFWLLPNLGLLVLNRAFNEKKQMRKRYYPLVRRPVEWLVLDQRTGPKNWDGKQTAVTLRRLCLQEIESVVLVQPLADAATIVWNGIRDTAPERFALLPLDGELHVAVCYRRPRLARFLLYTPEPVLRAFELPCFFITHLTLAQHMPSAALEYLANARLSNVQTLTLWLNPAADGLCPLLMQSTIRIGTALQEIRLVADFPRLPDVCVRYLADPPTRASCTVVANELLVFIQNHSWPTVSVAVVLGHGVGLVGGPLTFRWLMNWVASITRMG